MGNASVIAHGVVTALKYAECNVLRELLGMKPLKATMKTGNLRPYVQILYPDGYTLEVSIYGADIYFKGFIHALRESNPSLKNKEVEFGMTYVDQFHMCCIDWIQWADAVKKDSGMDKAEFN